MWNPFKKQSDPIAERKSHALLLGMGKYSGMGANYQALATEGYAYNAIANACISKIASAVASVDIECYVQDKEGSLVKKHMHPLEELIESPNQLKSGKAFMRDIVTQYLIGGNAFILAGTLDDELKSAPSSLYMLSPAKVEIERGDTMPLYYKYKPKTGSEVVYAVNQLTGKSKVLHLKTPNPLDEFVGLAPMMAASYGIDIFNAGMKWNKKLLDNDCRPAGALMVDGGDGRSGALSDEQYLRLKEEIQQQFSGASNAGRPLLLEGGLTWKELSINPKDMDYRENILMAARFIAGVFHVPPQLVNIPGESTYSNYEQAEMSFWMDTVLPLLSLILEDINRWLSPLYKDGAFLWYDEDSITALEPMRRLKSERLNNSAYLSTNEKRYAMGFEKQEGGDEVLVDSGKIPLSLLEVTLDQE